jgi:hypothetical protein
VANKKTRLRGASRVCAAVPSEQAQARFKTTARLIEA